MPQLEPWDWERYRAYLRTRAAMVRLSPKARARFDESDLVQETLMKAADPATPPCAGTSDRERLAWLERIQNNLLIDRHREMHAGKRDIAREQAFQQFLDESTVHWENQVPADQSTPLDQLARKELSLLVANAIQGLPDDQRDVMICRELLQLTLNETAEALSKSIGAVAGLYRRGLNQLKAQLQNRHDS